MSDQEQEQKTDERARDAPRRSCPACGAANRAGDRYCAACGTPLPAEPDRDAAAQPAANAASPPPNGVGTTATRASAGTGPATEKGQGQDQDQDREGTAWIFGARPATVIAGGLLLLVLAVVLLVIGQRDDTGTIVMLSICTAPLGLLTLAIGIARAVAGAAKRG